MRFFSKPDQPSKEPTAAPTQPEAQPALTVQSLPPCPSCGSSGDALAYSRARCCVNYVRACFYVGA
jgi:hypothetical protein